MKRVPWLIAGTIAGALLFFPWRQIGRGGTEEFGLLLVQPFCGAFYGLIVGLLIDVGVALHRRQK